ncbi:MAG: cell division ATP-binding protein FtsE [Firmicutes bacterium]|nr:cell division ATP-binding protein FtsE [Bacillota bacterium]
MIKLENVTKIYENDAIGLDDASVEIKKGDFVFIIGASGAGKSSFIRLLLKEIEADKGSIFIDGTDITQIKKNKIPFLRRKLGVVFQDFKLLPSKTVYENVAFALLVTETEGSVIRKKVPQVLKKVGLYGKKDAYPAQLSGGEKQRVAIARAIVNDPLVLIADEPTGNLDPLMAEEIMSLLEDINKSGTTVVVSTHARELVDSMKKRVITVKKGKFISDNSSGGYFE